MCHYAELDGDRGEFVKRYFEIGPRELSKRKAIGNIRIGEARIQNSDDLMKLVMYLDCLARNVDLLRRGLPG